MSIQFTHPMLRTQLQRAIAPLVPGAEAHARVLDRVHAATTSGVRAGSRRRAYIPSRLLAVMVGVAIAALLGGAIGAVFALRHGNQISPPPAPVPAGHGHTPAPSPSINPCGGADISVKFGASVGAAGSDGFDIELRNTGSVTCTLRGYATLGARSGQAGTQVISVGVTHDEPAILINAQSGTLRPVTTVTLEPGKIAYFGVEYSTVPSGDGACATPTVLTVTPPDSNQSTAIDLSNTIGAVCGGHGQSVWVDETPVSAAPVFGANP